MAIDSAQKRVSIGGVGRPFIRATWPDATKGGPWRASVGNTYAMQYEPLIPVAFVPEFIIRALGGGFTIVPSKVDPDRMPVRRR